jgi:hypothetical protein
MKPYKHTDIINITVEEFISLCDMTDLRELISLAEKRIKYFEDTYQ